MIGAKSVQESHVLGPTDMPLRQQTLGSALDTILATHGNELALVSAHQSMRLSWKQLSDRADSLAAGFLRLGLTKGDRVAIWSPNCVEWIETLYACARLGLILVNVNPAYRVPELEHALNLAGCRALVLAERFRTSDYVAMLGTLRPDLVDPQQPRGSALPALDHAICLSGQFGTMVPFADCFQPVTGEIRDQLTAIGTSLTPDDPVNIQFTSGTTGAPKGATLTHNNILNNADCCAQVLGITAADRICVPLPLYHCFGMVVGALVALATGAVLVLPGPHFEAGDVLQAVEAEGCTVLYGVPTMFIAELAHPDFAEFDLSTLRTGVMGGAPCPIDVMRKVVDDMHLAEMTIAYGMTETSPVSFQTRRDASLEVRTETVGTAHPHVEARVVDADDSVVPAGDVGELHIRGYSVMAGYWNAPAATAATITPDGWMRTGDLATIDELGLCRIVGRSKDMIIRGGENIYPVELENFLIEHPAILDIAVFGIPDALMGEQVCAWIKRTGEITETDVKAFCADRLAHYKIPQHIRFVEEFPMTVTGKPQKFVMREMEVKAQAEAEREN